MINFSNTTNSQYNHVILIRGGLVGATGQDGAMSDTDVISVINAHMTATPSTDAIVINDGNISVDIDSLPDLPI